MRRVTVIGGVVAAFVLGACGSGSAAVSGEAIIEKELADQIGLGELDATCVEPDGLVEGETFTCTATTPDEQTIELLGTMTSDDKFDIVTTNLLVPSDLVAISEEGARVLSEEIGTEVLAEDIDCGGVSVVLDDIGDFVCAITDTATGDVYDLTVSTGGLVAGEGVRELSFQVGDTPR